jgi:hypothetical protein
MLPLIINGATHSPDIHPANASICRKCYEFWFGYQVSHDVLTPNMDPNIQTFFGSNARFSNYSQYIVHPTLRNTNYIKCSGKRIVKRGTILVPSGAAIWALLSKIMTYNNGNFLDTDFENEYLCVADCAGSRTYDQPIQFPPEYDISSFKFLRITQPQNDNYTVTEDHSTILDSAGYILANTEQVLDSAKLSSVYNSNPLDMVYASSEVAAAMRKSIGNTFVEVLSALKTAPAKDYYKCPTISKRKVLMKDEQIQKYLGWSPTSQAWYNNVMEFFKVVPTDTTRSTVQFWNLYAKIMYPSPEIRYIGYDRNLVTKKLKETLPEFV